MISLSEVRKYVRVRFPGGSAKKYTHYLGLCSSGLRLVSASIHLEQSKAKLSGYEYQLMKLGIASTETLTHPPVESTWLRENVSLFIAEKGSVFDPKHDLFHEHVAANIAKEDNASKGGTLVLCTSYDLIDKLHHALDGAFAPERLLVQASGQSLSKNKAKYLALYHAGKRPVWLATGGAWTGLDLADFTVPAKDDHVISRLIIPKLPFNVPDNDVKNTIFDSGQDSYFKLKQGFGRLVRRAGRQNMRLVLLDRRIHTNNALYKSSFKLLKQYKNNLI
jgi:ATP-dependent DNA helicase DinG